MIKLKRHLIIMYSLFVFSYIFMRIFRDILLVSKASVLGSSIAKFISIFFVLLYVHIQRKLIQKYNIKKLTIIILMIFLFCILCFEIKLIPSLARFVHPSMPEVLKQLLGNSDVLIFYLISELFVDSITLNFWMICSSIVPKDTNLRFYNKIFTFAQLGSITAALLLIFSNTLTAIPCIISLILILFMLIFYIPDIPHITALDKPKDFKQSLNQWKFEIFCIPIMTILCGIIAGIIDPYLKYNLSIKFNHLLYKKLISSIWIVQSVLCMICSMTIVKMSHGKFVITPIAILILISIFLFCKLSNISIAIIVLILVYFVFKITKYSFYSPAKERYINSSHFNKEILFFEGYVSRIGKNLTAMILSLCFINHLNWANIEYIAIITVIILSLIWFLVAKSIKINSIPPN